MDHRKVYKVEISEAAYKRYNLEVLNYLSTYFSEERVAEIDDKIIDKANSLKTFPLRGTNEKFITHPLIQFRFILFNETDKFELKIVYYVLEEVNKVIITDFFPTQKDFQFLQKRS